MAESKNNNRITRQQFKALAWMATLLVGAMVVLSAVNHRKGAAVKGVEVEIKPLPNGDLLMQPVDVTELIHKAFGYEFQSRSVRTVEIERLEQVLEKDPLVQDAEVFLDARDFVRVTVTQREPVIRIIDKDGWNYYLDKNGIRMPLSKHFTARVVVATGSIPVYVQKLCMTPVDNEAPCPPVLNVSSQCDSLYNKLEWSVTDPDCLADVAGYKIYYKMNTVENLGLINTINDKYTFSFKHSPGDIIAACYAVTAFDVNGNESEKSDMVCIDSCNFYEIPNVFTPNGDDINDKLVAKTSGLVEKVNFSLFNRNGLLLFKTEEPKINWDGTYKGKIVSPGVYFYQCDVYEMRISGLEQFHLSGFVHVITEQGAKVKSEATK